MKTQNTNTNTHKCKYKYTQHEGKYKYKYIYVQLRFVSPWCQTCPSAIHIAYTLYIHYTSCTYIALEIANTVLHSSVFTLFSLQVNLLYTLLYVHRFPLYTNAVHYVTHRVPQCSDHLHRFRCLPRTYIHMCDFPIIIISLKFQVRCETGFICFPWFRVFEGC